MTLEKSPLTRHQRLPFENNLTEEVESQAQLQSALFHDLKQRTRWLEQILIILIASIPLLPPTAFFITELNHERNEAQHLARHLLAQLVDHASNRSVDRSTLISRLQQNIGTNAVLSIVITRQGQDQTIRLREPGYAFPPIRATVFFPPSLRPLETMRVEMDNRSLLSRTARIFGIHLVVAALLVFAVHRLSVRPLHNAIHQLEVKEVQLIHSEKLSALGTIYAGLAHEINNPLGIIIAKVALLLSTAEERQFRPDLVRDLEMINRHGIRITEIIRSLLVFTRKTSFALTDTDLNHLIGEIISLVEKPFSNQGIQILTALDRALPYLRTNPTLLQQVFLNLFNNARDAMPQGGTITVRTYLNDGSVVAEVQDTGAGLSEEVQERIFEPFFTTKGVGKGTGLGLSVSYGIIRTHGGDIEVKSTPGHGALFRIRLPMGGAKL